MSARSINHRHKMTNDALLQSRVAPNECEIQTRTLLVGEGSSIQTTTLTWHDLVKQASRSRRQRSTCHYPDPCTFFDMRWWWPHHQPSGCRGHGSPSECQEGGAIGPEWAFTGAPWHRGEQTHVLQAPKNLWNLSTSTAGGHRSSPLAYCNESSTSLS
jgi:hypothetical protein